VLAVKKQKRRLITRKERGLRYPVEYVASELGIDRTTLDRRCEEAGFHLNGAGLTFREAYDALSLKSASEAARRRKNLAEAEASEIDTRNKKGLTIVRTFYEYGITDLSVQTRVKIESASYITKEDRRRLIKEIAEIKPAIAEPSQ
jgi:hypothetical protein